MKKFAALYTIIFVINVVFVLSGVKLVDAGKIDNGELRAYFSFAGIKKYTPTSQEVLASTESGGGEDVVLNPEQMSSYFSQILTNNKNLDANEVPALGENAAFYSDTDMSPIKVDPDMIYSNSFTELPLFDSDYYWGKYHNGRAGAMQLNYMPIFVPGNSVGILRDKYVNIREGYIKPPHYYNGSGVCWASSTLGALQDKANADFRAKYGVDLFIFNPGDRTGHGGTYMTYTNNHHGYTIFQISYGSGAPDYRFTINPDLKNIEGLSDIKIKIVMLYTEKYPTASHGEALAGYIISNKQF